MVTELDEKIERDFTYHPPQADKQPLYATIRNLGRDMAYKIKAVVPPGREQALAITKLEEAVMWANAGIARNGQ